MGRAKDDLFWDYRNLLSCRKAKRRRPHERGCMQVDLKCPFQVGHYVSSCRANAVVYVPSRFEYKEYCKTKLHKICPVYLDAADNHDSPARLVPPRTVTIEGSSA